MGNIVLKIPGAGLINVAEHDTSIPWHGYRGIHIATDFFCDLLKTLKKLEETEKVFLACGSTGSFLYTDLAKILNITRHHFLDDIGISVTRILIKILIEFFSSNGLCVCPHSVDCSKFPPTQLNEYCVFFISPQQTFNSSDHLAVIAARELQASSIFFVKQGVPYFYVGFEEKTKKDTFSLQDLQKISSSYNEQPGKKYVLDKDAIRILLHLNSKKYFISPHSITELPQIISSGQPGDGTTKITN